MAKNLFEYQAPTDQQVETMKAFRAMCKRISEFFDEVPMEPRCRALAKTKLEEVSMWGNKGIVFYES